jgi:hypothetical protein
MTPKQEDILKQEFKVNEHFAISRGDYENMPDPMLAWNWTDEQMRELAGLTNQNLCLYDKNDPEGMEDDFWKTMEDCAVYLGMRYYEDMDDNEIAELDKEFAKLK